MCLASGGTPCLFGSCVYPVTSLTLVRGQLFAAGGYSLGPGLDGRPRGFLARWDGATWTHLVAGAWTLDVGEPYRYTAQPHVWALAARGNDLCVAGNFASIGDTPSYGFGIWHEGEPLTVRAAWRAGRLVLSCPREFQAPAVESAGSPASSAWLRVPDVAWTVSHTDPDVLEVELTPSLSQVFYRLSWPD